MRKTNQKIFIWSINVVKIVTNLYTIQHPIRHVIIKNQFNTNIYFLNKNYHDCGTNEKTLYAPSCLSQPNFFDCASFGCE